MPDPKRIAKTIEKFEAMLERHKCSGNMVLLKVNKERHVSTWQCWICGEIKERKMRF